MIIHYYMKKTFVQHHQRQVHPFPSMKENDICTYFIYGLPRHFYLVFPDKRRLLCLDAPKGCKRLLFVGTLFFHPLIFHRSPPFSMQKYFDAKRNIPNIFQQYLTLFQDNFSITRFTVCFVSTFPFQSSRTGSIN